MTPEIGQTYQYTRKYSGDPFKTCTIIGYDGSNPVIICPQGEYKRLPLGEWEFRDIPPASAEFKQAVCSATASFLASSKTDDDIRGSARDLVKVLQTALAEEEKRCSF